MNTDEAKGKLLRCKYCQATFPYSGIGSWAARCPSCNSETPLIFVDKEKWQKQFNL